MWCALADVLTGALYGILGCLLELNPICGEFIHTHVLVEGRLFNPDEAMSFPAHYTKVIPDGGMASSGFGCQVWVRET